MMRKMTNKLPKHSKPSLHKAQVESCSGYRTWLQDHEAVLELSQNLFIG